MFSERLKSLRKEKGLEAQYVAEKLNVAKSTYSGYENNKSKPSFEILESIAMLFDVSVDYLLGRTDVKKYDTEISAFSTISTDGLSDEDIEAVRSIVEALKKKHGK